MKIFRKIDRNLKKIFGLRKYRPLGRKYRLFPVKPWAFIRVCNEAKTIEASLNSILPVITRGVIGYNPSNDGTEEIILKFCQDNPGFIPVLYPHNLVPANSEEYLNPEKIPVENRLDTYYNTIMSHIPDGQWLIKIDVDQVYDSEKLKQLMFLPINKFDMIGIGRLNCHYDNGDIYLYKPAPFYDVFDHWLIYKNSDLKFEMNVGPNDHNFFAYECLKIRGKFQSSQRVAIPTDCLTWHFPLLKECRNYIFKQHPQNFISLNDNIRTELLSLTPPQIKPDMLDEKRILNIINQFKL